MTDAEIDALQSSGLHRRTPYAITRVKWTYFSPARFYGSCTYQGERYLYDPTTDMLIREDCLKWLRKREHERSKQGRAEARQRAREAQGTLI